MKPTHLSTLLLALALAAPSAPADAAPAEAAPPRLKVSENRRFLVHEDGRPFFYLGDTAWELFHRLNREEAERYLQDRSRKGFTVVPLELYWKNGNVKLAIGLAKGKQAHDKRHTEKDRDWQREKSRQLRNRG